MTSEQLEALAQRRADLMVEALLQNVAMDETAAYLRRGRAYAQVSVERIEGLWTQALGRWIKERGSVEQREMDDLAAELRLRGHEPPYDCVREELDAMAAEIKASAADDQHVRERIRDFLESLDKPPN